MSTIGGGTEVCYSAKWDDEQRDILIQILTEVQADGRGAEQGYNKGYKKDSWRKIVGTFAERTGRHYSQQQISSYISSLKSEWITYKGIANNEGFDWHETTQSVVADQATWICLIGNVKFKGCDKYRHGFPNCMEMEAIFTGRVSSEVFPLETTSSESRTGKRKITYDVTNPEKILVNRKGIDKSTSSQSSSSSSSKKKKDESSNVESSSTNQSNSAINRESREETFEGQWEQDASSSDDGNDDNHNLINQTRKKDRTSASTSRSTEDLVTLVSKIFEGINALRPPPPLPLPPPPDKLMEAFALLSKKYCREIDPEDSLLLKLFWCENKHHAQLFLGLTHAERICYVRKRIAFLKQKIIDGTVY